MTQPNQIASGSLKGHVLIATPSLAESCFSRSVIYLCAHNEAGAMGVIVNAPIDNVGMDDIFDQLSIKPIGLSQTLPVHFGGPVEAGRGFVLHSKEYDSKENLSEQDGIMLTSSITVLKDLAEGKGPKQGILALGYAGWSPGQLEAEIEAGSWIVLPASAELLFNTENEMKWNMAISTLGIDVGHFSNIVGHA